MPTFSAIAARWLPLARKAAGLADVPASAFGRAWDKGTLRDRRMLATIAQVPHPEDVAALPWLKVPDALRPVLGNGVTLTKLVLRDGNPPGELRIILPYGSFSLRESLEYASAGQRYLLEPLALVEQTTDYELARYRQTVLGAA